MIGITKTIIQVTILHPTGDKRINGYSLGDIGYEIDEGDWIGTIETISVASVPPEKVSEELRAIGGDDTFFEGYD